ncbi:MAG: UDP-N-acetylmuramoyl-L-alanine--D-glutamate ligase, partial [Spirochaetales bacterium]
VRDPSKLKPKIAIITNLFPDHQDRYPDMESYARDKAILFRNQTKEDATLVHADDSYGKRFYKSTPGTPYWVSSSPLPSDSFGAYLKEGVGLVQIGGKQIPVVPEQVHLVGLHQKKNLLFAALGLYLFGVPPEAIQESMAEFPGVEHRLEFCGEVGGVRFYNDSAATVPEATACGIQGFSTPLLLITGGTDKNLDFTPLKPFIHKPKEIYLLEGTGTEKLKILLQQTGKTFHGPYSNLQQAVYDAFKIALSGDTILFSPGCTSFGMFLNEFDRGRKFKAIVQTLKGAG